MQVKKGTYSCIADAQGYLDYVKEKYSSFNGYEYFVGDLLKALEYTLHGSHQHATCIQTMHKGKMQAHAMLIEDSRLNSGEALFGFLECENDDAVFRDMWKILSAMMYQKRIRFLRGPINGSIWHQYRIIKKGTEKVPYFNSEPLSMPWYFDFLKSMKPFEEVNYYSGIRTQLTKIAGLTKPSFDKLTAEGYRFNQIENLTGELMHSLYILSGKIFRKNWSYIDLDEKQFNTLYSGDKLKKHINDIYLAYHDDELIGFCMNIRDGNNLIMKTIGILPDYQRKGAGNALVHLVHRDAMEKGINGIIYALIRDSNNIRFFPKDDAVIFREYACFTFKMNKPCGTS